MNVGRFAELEMKNNVGFHAPGDAGAMGVPHTSHE